MIRKMLLGVGLAVGAGMLVGCDGASSAKPMVPNDGGKSVTDKMKEAAAKTNDKVKETGDKMADKGKELGDKGKELGDKGKDLAKDAAEAARKTVLDPVTEAMPKIEDKIKGLSGDVATKAKEKFEALKKLVEEFKAAPTEKLAEVGKKITEALAELKKSVGL